MLLGWTTSYFFNVIFFRRCRDGRQDCQRVLGVLRLRAGRRGASHAGGHHIPEKLRQSGERVGYDYFGEVKNIFG